MFMFPFWTKTIC